MRHVATLMLIVGLCCGVSYAQDVPDFDGIMQGLQARLNVATTGAWSDTTLWQNAGGPGYAQESPSFATGNHYYYNNVIPDIAHLALFEEVLKGGPCVRDILGDDFVNGVQAAFAQNQANVTTREAMFDLEVLQDTTRVTIKVSGFDFKRIPLGIDRFTAATNANSPVKIRANAGGIFGNTSLDADLDIPSLWGERGLFDRVSTGLDNDVRDLLAAYLTMGDQQGVDYIQAVLFQTFYGGVFPNIMTLVLSLVDIKGFTDDDVFIAWEPELDLGDKAYTPPQDPATIDIYDNTETPIPNGSIDLTIHAIHAKIYGAGSGAVNIQTGILQHWLNWYSVGINGFHSGYSGYFGGTDQLTPTSPYATINDAWLNSEDIEEFLANAGTDVFFGWDYGLTAPAAPINYGGAYNMMAQAMGGSGNPVTYQWYSGPDESSLTAITGATGKSYTANVDFYSFGGTTQQRTYRVVATTEACGTTRTVESDAIIIGGTPPPINFNTQPASANVKFGAKATLAVSVSVGAGAPTYQWQKYDNALGWVNVSGATASSLVINSATTADAGDYRCRVFNVVAGNKADKANPEYYADSNAATLNVAPAIVFDQQPLSASLDIGEDYQLVAEASVSDGNLEYRWFRNPGTGFTALGDWVDTGATSFVATLDITDAQLSDSGLYRLSVRNTLAPFGAYEANSANANVNVSSGVVFFVDPTGDDTDGLSWETAFNTLQTAVDAASAGPLGGEVWVAGGPVGAPIVYDELRTEVWGDHGATGSLVMKDNVALYGGFEGYRGGDGEQEDNRLFRNRAQNIAVIDGSVARAGGAAYHVVVFGRKQAATIGASIDGFVITGGNAAGIAADYDSHRGGGIYNYGSVPTVNNCIITANSANVSGGGMANEVNEISGMPGDALITNCVFSDNYAARGADGMPGPDGGTPVRGGGAIFNNASSPVLNFVTIVNNAVDNSYVSTPGPEGSITYGLSSGGIFTFNANTTLSNSIVYGNTGSIVHQLKDGGGQVFTVTYSDIEGGFAGTGNINVDPLLGNADYTALLGADIGNYVPAENSPVIDAADPHVGGDDYLGVPRPLFAAPDMGAFELSLSGPQIECVASQMIDFIQTPSLEDPFLLVNQETMEFEAPFWKLYMEDKVFGCDDIPMSSIAVTALDILGREATCDADVPVTESEAPVAVCNPLTVELDANGTYTLDTDDLLDLAEGSYDNCSDADNLIVTASPDTFTCDEAGRTINVTVTVEDEEGNTDSCTALVTVNDSIAPVAADPANAISVNLTGQGIYNLSNTDIDALKANATDNCGVNFAASTVDTTSFSCADIGDNTVAVTWVDFHGNSTVGAATVTVNDVHPPTLQGVIHRNFSLQTGNFTEAQALDGVVATDICDGNLSADITVEVFDADGNPVDFDVPTSWPVAPGQSQYEFTLVYSVKDYSGNEATANAVLTFHALQLPEITIIGDDPLRLECGHTFFLGTEAGYAHPDDDFPITPAHAYDPMTGSDITDFMNAADYSNINTNVVGDEYSITYSVNVPGYPGMDPVTAVRQVIVEDTADPVFTGVTARGFSLADGPFTEEQALAGVTADDKCEGDLTDDIVAEVFNGATLVPFPIPADMDGDVVFTLKYTVADSADNEAEVSTILSYTDIVPKLTLLGDVPLVLECGVPYDAATMDPGAEAIDPVTGDDITEEIIATPSIGTSTVNADGTITYSVAVPNYPTLDPIKVVRPVTVQDTTDPVIAGVAPKAYNSRLTGAFTEEQALAGVSAADSCEGVLAIEVEVLDQDDNSVDFPIPDDWALDAGETTYVFTLNYFVEDGNGNDASASTTLTFTDIQDPIITLNGGDPLVLECGVTFTPALDPGVVITDPMTGDDISDSVDITYAVNTDAVGDGGTITYSVAVPNYPTLPEVVVVLDVEVEDTLAPKIDGERNRNYSSQDVGGFTEVMALAGVTAYDGCEGDLTSSLVAEVFDADNNPVDFADTENWDLQGENQYVFKLTYTVEDSEGNVATETVNLTYTDVVMPIIELDGDDPVYIECGDGFDPEEDEPGYSAIDPNTNDDLTGDVEVDYYEVDPDVPGTYVVTYTVAVPGYPELDPVVETRRFIVQDTTAPVISGVTDRVYNVGTGPFTLAQAKQGVIADDVCAGSVTHNIVAEVFDADDNLVLFPIPTNWPLDEGEVSYTFTLKYSVTDGRGNSDEVEAELRFDDILPKLSLLGDDPLKLECGDVFVIEDDLGITAIDPQTGNEIAEVIADYSDLDTTVVDDYVITYAVAVPGYPALPMVEIVRAVVVEDTLEPVITLTGGDSIIVELGTAWLDPGYTAYDQCDGDISDAVVVTGAPDMEVQGIYTLTYNVTDSSDFDADTVERTVVVAQQVVFTIQPAGARLYTSDAPHFLVASYEGGFDVTGHEWLRDGAGLGLLAPETEGNTVGLEIDPAAHDLGVFEYQLRVIDMEEFPVYSDVAEVEIAKPMTVDSGLTDQEAKPGDEVVWKVEVSGGLGTLKYQWFLDRKAEKAFMPVQDGAFGEGAFAGSDTATLQLVPFVSGMAGKYKVEVSDDLQTITVGPASLVEGTGIPAASALGIAVLALATALGGARALRKRD